MQAFNDMEMDEVKDELLEEFQVPVLAILQSCSAVLCLALSIFEPTQRHQHTKSFLHAIRLLASPICGTGLKAVIWDL